MKHPNFGFLTTVIAGLCLCLFGWLSAAPLTNGIDACDVVWDSPGTNAAGSMPIGNGEVGLNVWAEPDGDLVFYVARTDAWSECCRLLKLGRVRIRLLPNPFGNGQPFRQELKLRDGQIVIHGGDVMLRVFVDADAPVVYVEGRSRTPHQITATWETWRNEKHVLTGEELTSSWTMRDAPADIKVWESADVVTNSPANTVLAWHRNAYSVVPLTLKHQGLESVAGLVNDPLRDRTFGARMSGQGFVSAGVNTLKSARPLTEFNLSIATHTAQTRTLVEWEKQIAQPVKAETAARRTAAWWNNFWSRSWIFVREGAASCLPSSSRALQLGVDSNGGSRFQGEITNAMALNRVLSADEIAALAREKPGCQTPNLTDVSLNTGFTVAAWIKPAPGEAGRIFDKITAGGSDGFLFDTYPGLSLRLIVGAMKLTASDCLKAGEWQHVAATVSASGGMRIYLNGNLLKVESGEEPGRSRITQAYVLQRWITACGGRGHYPIKFNGSIFTVDPKFAGGPDFNADWRRWGDCYWWQNMRFPCFSLMADGDFDEAHPLFRVYEDALPLCEARAKLYYGAEGAYFPETMTIFGTYANSDYGWNRQGHPPGEILSPWWRYAWQQGLELTALMLDYYEYTGDKTFLNHELIPMANAVLRYYDTRFKRDNAGKLVISPTQAVETYRHGVVNDTPSVAGLTDVCQRLLRLPASKADHAFWQRMKDATPSLPIKDGCIQPAEKFDPQRGNVENPELYALWPFHLYGVGLPDPAIAVETFRHRLEKASVGWQYDGQCAAIAGLADEAGRILLRKVGSSNSNFRFPAMWGPNYDWLPDQDHGSNIMLTLQNMILQSDGDKLYLLPAWPKDWDVSFKLYAPKNTVVEGSYHHGKLVALRVTPESRRPDLQVMVPE
jgi:Domain of unknown function (DUF5703)/Concanavalin A-like lectin/glucanases superfamily/Glycosyl hydrolase family 95 catalytic domain